MNSYDSIIPFGTILKQLISHSAISDSDLREFANRKGIFTNNYSRESIIPLLESMLITPSDFSFLKSKHKVRIERPKRIKESIKVEKDADLLVALEDFIFDAENNERFTNYKFIDRPVVLVEDGDPTITYRIERTDLMQDLFEQKTEHTAKLKFRKSGDKLFIDILTEYSSDETKKINGALISDIKDHLVGKGIVDRATKRRYIMFDDFSHANRARFFLDHCLIETKQLSFVMIEDANLAPVDISTACPTDLKWMKDKVSRLKLAGKNIQEINIFKDQANYDNLIIENLYLKFSFKLGKTIGETVISIAFPKVIQTRLPDTAFQFTFDSTKIMGGLDDLTPKKIENILTDIFNIENLKLYEKYLKPTQVGPE